MLFSAQFKPKPLIYWCSTASDRYANLVFIDLVTQPPSLSSTKLPSWGMSYAPLIGCISVIEGVVRYDGVGMYRNFTDRKVSVTFCWFCDRDYKSQTYIDVNKRDAHNINRTPAVCVDALCIRQSRLKSELQFLLCSNTQSLVYCYRNYF